MSDEFPAYDVIHAAFESPQAMLAMIRTDPSLLEARTGLGETPLHYLAVEDQLDAVKLLVDAGAEVNTVNVCGGTPLSEAASLGYVQLVGYLLSKGARLRLDGQRDPTLHAAVDCGDVDLVKLVLAVGAAVDERNSLDETALHIAARDDARLAILELLLQAGANVSLRCMADETPLDVARAAGASACAAALLAAR